MKTISILGATGSIGMSTIDVIRHHKDKFRIKSLQTHTNTESLFKLAVEFNVKKVVVTNEESLVFAKKNIPDGIMLLSGKEGLIDIATDDDVDIVVSSLVGAVGLEPTIAAIKKNKRIALANKEVLVIAGEYIHENYASELKNNIFPVDSEHSAIFQSLQGEKKEHVEKIILTASGGPFLHTKKENFKSITPQQALKHPNWSMGSKITIDSATMMNKGLEVIEARWLFDVLPENIEVLIHPESIIHSMVQFVDGSIIGQMGIADMRLPIQYALGYPTRIKNPFPRVDFAKIGSFNFFTPDTYKFPLINTAYKALKMGNIYPAAMNAANEIAVESFLNKKITFDKIPILIENIMLNFEQKEKLTLEEIIKTDTQARLEAIKWVQKNQ
ncbi:MAG: 1-deoxy-D-xylulose-5-phosphate reductoisomerase [Candidatus Aureabacteria bacterium]|nr:1-deoxy-D-xylulose-5-phosphate reductoisomerase [Candidatus Auribacterota bacterium]